MNINELFGSVDEKMDELKNALEAKLKTNVLITQTGSNYVQWYVWCALPADAERDQVLDMLKTWNNVVIKAAAGLGLRFLQQGAASGWSAHANKAEHMELQPKTVTAARKGELLWFHLSGVHA